MKKTLYSLLIALIITAMMVCTCYAADENIETDISTDTSDTSETLEDYAQGEKEDFIAEITSIVTNAEIWAKIGLSVLAALAFIALLRSKTNSIMTALDAVKNFVAGKATKEDTEKVVKESLADLKSAYLAEYTALESKYEDLKSKTDHQTAILSLLSLQLVKSPNARVHIMDLISKGESVCGDISEVVKEIEAAIEQEDAAEPKPDTPALDAVIASVTDTAGGNEEKTEDISYIALG